MRAILKRTAYLFWQHPILWLPVLLADFCKYWVAIAGVRIGRIASYALLPHSLISGLPETPTGARLFLFSATAGLFKGIASLVGIALYCYALSVVAKSVSRFEPSNDAPNASSGELPADPIQSEESEQPPECRIGDLDWSLPKSLLRCSGMVFLAFAVAVVTSLYLMPSLARSPWRLSNYALPWSSVLLYCLVGLLTVPSVLAFIARNISQESTSIHNDPPLQHPRVLAFGIALIFCFVEVLFGGFSTKVAARIFEIPILHTRLFDFVHGMITSLVDAIPFIPAMIALVLIKQQEMRPAAVLVPLSDQPDKM